MKRKMAILVDKKKFEILEEDIPALQPHEIMFKTVSVGMCHSDMPTYAGDAAMWFDEYGHYTMIKDIQYPTLVGHEAVGIVEEVGSDVTTFEVGDYVAGSSIVMGYSSHTLAPAKFCIKLPKTIPLNELKYWLLEPTICCANIAKAASPKFGDIVAVVGCGMMNLLTMKALSHSSAKKIIAIDLDDSRLALAKKFGATHTINPKTTDFKAEINRLTNNKGADKVIEGTGNLKGLKTAIKAVRYADIFGVQGRGEVYTLSLYSHKENWDPELGYELMFHSPIIHVTHPPYINDFEKLANDTIDAIQKKVLPISSLITHEFKIDDIQKAFKLMESGNSNYIKGIITF
ncbi:zinc-binding dehydrogenase [Vallitaleaceae bacterium 9-2]